MIDHNILYAILHYVGLSGQLIRSYLTNKTQRVTLDGVLSETLQVRMGVPQGSTLGPLLYIVYTSNYFF